MDVNNFSFFSDEASSVGRRDPINLEIEDENTMPSAWTPNRLVTYPH